MEITKLETVRFDSTSELVQEEGGNEITVLRVHTDEGVIGLGETFPQGGMETAAIHGRIAEMVIGRDPMDIEGIRHDLATYFNFHGYAGAEFRALSALDIGLWDLKGRVAGLPIYELLGGKSRSRIPVYNTCYDHYDFESDPVGLAESLLDQGLTSMKIWPFDRFAHETRGHRISRQDLQAGVRPLREIRDAFGDEMDIAIEGHGYWSLTPAKEIVAAVEPYSPIWVEDILPKGNLAAYRVLSGVSNVPLCLGERHMSRYEFVDVLDSGAIDVLKPDVCWVGGLSEAKAVATMAEAYHLPIAPHNAGGPILHFASAHLSASVPNLYMMEIIRDRYDGWHRNLVTEPLAASDGFLPLPEGPGLGTDLEESVLDDPATTVVETSA